MVQMAFCDLSQTFHKQVTNVFQHVFVILLWGILMSPYQLYIKSPNFGKKSWLGWNHLKFSGNSLTFTESPLNSAWNPFRFMGWVWPCLRVWVLYGLTGVPPTVIPILGPLMGDPLYRMSILRKRQCHMSLSLIFPNVTCRIEEKVMSNVIIVVSPCCVSLCPM